MSMYEGKDLRFFGKMKIREEGEITTITGGSTNTTAYKVVTQFLQSKFNIANVETKVIEGDGTFHNKRQARSTTPNEDKIIKTKTTAYLLWFFLGIFGAHKFYLNKPGIGILYFLTCGIFFIGWIVDLFTLGRQVDQYNVNP